MVGLIYFALMKYVSRGILDNLHGNVFQMMENTLFYVALQTDVQ